MFFCAAFFQATAQETEVVKVTVLGQDEGLLQLNAQALAQDELGYLWVGTEDGLHRFNSYEFTAFLANPTDTTSIKDDHIRGLEAVGDTLWIATNSQGIVGYQQSKNLFFEVLSESNRDYKIGHNVFTVNEKLLLFAVKNHFILFDRAKKTYKSFQLPESERENFVSDVFLLNNNQLLLATSVSGILSFNLKTEKSNSFSKTFDNLKVSSFLKNNETLYIGSEIGLSRYNLETKTFAETKIKQATIGIHKIDAQNIYVATTTNVLKYNLNEDKFNKIIFQNKDNTLFENVVVERFANDDKSNLWLGTAGNGVLYINKFQTKFTTYQVSIPSESSDKAINIFPFFKKDQNLWLGTGAGTIRFNAESGAYNVFEKGKGGITYTFAEDQNGTLWVGTIFDGLLKYDPKTDSFRQFLNSPEKNSLPDNEVLEIIPMSKNKLWLCTWSGGISEFDIENETFTPILINEKKLDRVRTHFRDGQNNLWLGADEGLFKIISEGKAKHYFENSEEKNKLTNNRVFAINEDKIGNLWIGTSNGLTKLDLKTDQTSLFYKQKGFTNDFVYGVLIDTKNNVWMSTNYGLVVFNTEKNTFKNYTKDDGLQDNEFNGKSSYKANDGNFYFGGINGYNIFKPKDIVDNPFLPDVYIESVELFNQPVNRNEIFQDTLKFKSAENVLTFNFSALNYLNPQKCSYTYILENFDEKWSPPTTKRSVTYTNLNPGTYTLKIKATNDVGIWNENAKTLTLIIIPPWYKTTLFKIALFGSILLLGFLVYQFQTQKLKSDKRKLALLVAEQTKDLELRNKALKLSNETTLEQKKNIEFLMKELSHRVKNNLQIISSLLNIQANSVKDEKTKEIIKIAKNRILTISYIQSQLNSQANEVHVDQFFRDFVERMIETLSDDRSIKFETKFELQPNCICNINITLLGLILNELVTNTFKYAFDEYKESNQLRIRCLKKENILLFEIEDNGKGYETNSTREDSLGLELINEMVQQLKGNIKTTTKNGVANHFEIPC